ncbi:MAG: hypothetical protein M9891_17025, partial [Austwickia sp.]|nr:hypothetical protein [Austwickia sp.]
RHSWARSPVVFAQLVQLGLAWNFWGGSTGWVAGLLAAVAVVVLVAVMMPASTAALAPDD